MRSLIALVLVSAAVLGCGGGGEADDAPKAPCSDGEDNDSDGLVDFPDDLGCTSESDDTEDSLTSAKCQDGRDNDGDGKKDYPSDPGCFAPQADDETDDCPTGPSCPQCADGEDNDGNGSIDYPDDPGCTAAADDDEFLHNPVACGAGLMVMPLPTTGVASGMLDATSTSMLMSPCGGGGGAPAVAYELHLSSPRVVEVSTEDAATTADTVIDIRSEMCSSTDAHLVCNDDISDSIAASKVTVSLPAGDYYIVIGAHDTGSGGPYAMQVKTYAGEGATCATPADCGPGLVCRVPLGATAMVCSKPMCSDGVDDDGANDGSDYPNDPGCTTLDDNDETDDCPAGPNCPECADGSDNDNDTLTDYPADTTCLAAGDSSESCVTTDGVTLLTLPVTMGTTTGANNDVRPPPAAGCSSAGTHTAPDRTYRLDLPAMSSLNLNLTGLTPFWDSTSLLLNSTCVGTPIKCSDSPLMNVTNLVAGAYFFVVDGYSTGSGPYTLTVSGTIVNGASCESALAQSGALVCGTGYTCKGTAGSRTCQPGLCGDGMDNDGDGKTDYPFDPGCTSVGDDTEPDPTPAPACGNAMDDDTDSLSDWPADYGCSAASGTSEVFCTPEVDPTSLITTSPVTGTTAGKTNNFVNAMLCPISNPGTNGPDVAYGLALPVPVTSLVIDLSGSAFDTTLTFRDAQCAMQIACDDDGSTSGLQSLLTLSNVAAGNYAIVIDGFGSGTTGASGMYTMRVRGTAAVGTSCTSPLFQGGASAVLACPTACTAGVCN